LRKRTIEREDIRQRREWRKEATYADKRTSPHHTQNVLYFV
jgi:hypothetical protein